MTKIQDLIAKCDESEIFTQNLVENMIKGKVNKKNGEITFVTKPEFVYGFLESIPNPKIGIVIWFPADVFDRK